MSLPNTEELKSTLGMTVEEAVASRRSIREFSNDAVPLDVIKRVMEQARWAPSGCNYQPWEAVILTGMPLNNLIERLLASKQDDPQEYDFSVPSNVERYHDRLTAFAGAMYDSLDISREDDAARAAWNDRNLRGYGAPVLLLCHFPKFMMSAQWSDVGMWLQTIMLLLRGEGLDSCPLEALGQYGRTIKDELSLGDETLLFCGLAIGWRVPEAPVNNFDRERVLLDQHVSFRGFDM